MLPADQVARSAPFGLVHAQSRSVAAHPDQPLAMRRHQLAMIERCLAGAEQQLIVVEALPHPLMRSDRDQRAAFVAQLLQGQQPLVIGHDRVFEHDLVARFGAGMVPERRAR